MQAGWAGAQACSGHGTHCALSALSIIYACRLGGNTSSQLSARTPSSRHHAMAAAITWYSCCNDVHESGSKAWRRAGCLIRRQKRGPDQAPHLHEVHHLPGADEVAQLVRKDRGALHAHQAEVKTGLDQSTQQASYAAVLSSVPPKSAKHQHAPQKRQPFKELNGSFAAVLLKRILSCQPFTYPVSTAGNTQRLIWTIGLCKW